MFKIARIFRGFFTVKLFIKSALLGVLFFLVTGLGSPPIQPEVCIGPYCFKVDIADTDKKRQKGLMFVHEMPIRNGMLFVFPQNKRHPFWMKNTPIPLDIIWIDRSGHISHIHHSARPYDSTPIRPPSLSKFVLEINGGLSKKLGFKIGQPVRLPNRVFHNS